MTTAVDIHDSAYIFDAGLSVDGFNKDEEGEIRAVRDGKLSGAAITVSGPQDWHQRTIERIRGLKAIIDRHPDILMLCRSARDLQTAHDQDKLGLLIHFQDSKCLEDQIGWLDTFYDLGLRVLQLTYNKQGLLGTGCIEPYEGHLTEYGRDVVKRCNEMGILIDISHCSWGTCREAIESSEVPVAITHAGAYEVCKAEGRNKPDDIIKAVAENGGVIGLTWFPSLVKRDDSGRVAPSTVKDVVDHIDHVVDLVGVDHVGFGSDLSNYTARTLELPPTTAIRTYRPKYPHVYGYGPTDRYDEFPSDLDSHSKLINLTTELVDRGYSPEDVRAILGGNFLSLLKVALRG